MLKNVDRDALTDIISPHIPSFYACPARNTHQFSPVPEHINSVVLSFRLDIMNPHFRYIFKMLL
jgi:CRISPR/Cas system CMR subunit Cmr6 (Cas7 group RAMP superfamily)